MSMPAHRYSCTACAYESFSTVLWGQFIYELDSGPVYVNRRLGWCMACAKLVPIEAFPDASTIHDLDARVREVQEALSTARAKAAQSQSWIRRLLRIEPKLPVRLVMDLKGAQRDLAEAKQLAEALRGRTQPRCLICGSADCLVVPRKSSSSAVASPRGQPVPLGMAHPGCSGQLLRSSDGDLVSVSPRKRYYDRDGRLLRSE